MKISFKHFLAESEGESPEDAAKFVFENCKPFLKESDFNFNPATGEPLHALYRGGTYYSENKFMVEYPGGRNRKPVDSSQRLHDLLDEYLEKYFMFPYRSKGLFCTGSRKTAKEYGKPVLIFPIGNFKYVYSERIVDAYAAFQGSTGMGKSFDAGFTADMYNTIRDDIFKHDNPIIEKWSPTKDLEVVEKLMRSNANKWYECVAAWLEQEHPYTNRGLKKLLWHDEPKNEVMIQCDSYVCIKLGMASSLRVFAQELNHLIETGKKSDK